jgi:hypothetical protein
MTKAPEFTVGIKTPGIKEIADKLRDIKDITDDMENRIQADSIVAAIEDIVHTLSTSVAVI